jgi:hypothetical protein
MLAVRTVKAFVSVAVIVVDQLGCACVNFSAPRFPHPKPVAWLAVGAVAQDLPHAWNVIAVWPQSAIFGFENSPSLRLAAVQQSPHHGRAKKNRAFFGGHSLTSFKRW